MSGGRDGRGKKTQTMDSGNNALAMRLYASWDVDRSTGTTVPRIINLGIKRIFLDGVPPTVRSIVITTKLTELKKNRNLRSNEILINPDHGRVDLDCDISFCIQVIQQSTLGDVVLWPTGNALQPPNSANQKTVQSVGKLHLNACSSQAIEQSDDRWKNKKQVEGADSEEESDSDYDEVPGDIEDPTSARHTSTTSRRQNKNFKQKFAKLIRRFNKIPDAATVAAEVASNSGGRPPTKQELEALFEELSDFSDSGPEAMADDVSITSNPRPGLQPFFTRSRELLPAIYDGEPDVSESDVEEAGWSTETDINSKDVTKDSAKSQHRDQSVFNFTDAVEGSSKSTAVRVMSAGLQSSETINNKSFVHSQTMSSIAVASSTAPKKDHVSRVTSVSDKKRMNLNYEQDCSNGKKLSALLPPTIDTSDCVWLCNLSDHPHLGYFSSFGSLISCNSYTTVRQVLAHLVNRIQNFCNTNSVNPPMTFVGIVGNDRLFSHVLRAYVDCLSQKSSLNWLEYLRFAPLASPPSTIFKYLEGVDPQLDTLCREIWDVTQELTSPQKSSIEMKLTSWSKNPSSSRLNLPIGEALIQISPDRIVDKGSENGRFFMPFLCEVRVGIVEGIVTDDDSSGAVNSGQSPRDDPTTSRNENGSSPPHSPHSKQMDGRELSLEYWMGSAVVNNNYELSGATSTTPVNKKDAGKSTVKALFKSLVISRMLSGGLLSLTYLKEKKREKMLQKLGMKKGQKTDNDLQPVQVSPISRTLCSASGKHSEIVVFVDGTSYAGVRYFQTSQQWQTHMNNNNNNQNNGRPPTMPQVERVPGQARILRPQRPQGSPGQPGSPLVPEGNAPPRTVFVPYSSAQPGTTFVQQGGQLVATSQAQLEPGRIIVHRQLGAQQQQQNPQQSSSPRPMTPQQIASRQATASPQVQQQPYSPQGPSLLQQQLQQKRPQSQQQLPSTSQQPQQRGASAGKPEARRPPKTMPEKEFVEKLRRLSTQVRSEQNTVMDTIDTAVKEHTIPNVSVINESTKNVTKAIDDMMAVLTYKPVTPSGEIRTANSMVMLQTRIEDLKIHNEDTPEEEALFDSVQLCASADEYLTYAARDLRLYKEMLSDTMTTSSFYKKPLVFSSSEESYQKCISLFTSTVLPKEKLNTLPWKTKFVNIPSVKPPRFVLNVEHSIRKFPNVAVMRVMIAVRGDTVTDFVMGHPSEKLYNENGLIPSKYQCFRMFTDCALAFHIDTGYMHFDSDARIMLFHSIINNFCSCFNRPCAECGNHLRHFLPPTVVKIIRGKLYFYHRDCVGSFLPAKYCELNDYYKM